jgi:hypothetical protein
MYIAQNARLLSAGAAALFLAHISFGAQHSKPTVVRRDSEAKITIENTTNQTIHIIAHKIVCRVGDEILGNGVREHFEEYRVKSHSLPELEAGQRQVFALDPAVYQLITISHEIYDEDGALFLLDTVNPEDIIQVYGSGNNFELRHHSSASSNETITPLKKKDWEKEAKFLKKQFSPENNKKKSQEKEKESAA